jgi:hypothetical protein
LNSVGDQISVAPRDDQKLASKLASPNHRRARNPMIPMARREGLEPPTLRFEAGFTPS